MKLTRRRLLNATAAWAGAGFFSSFWPITGHSAEDALSPGRPFSFNVLVALARERSAQPYTPPPSPHADFLKALNYKTASAIRITDAGQRWRYTDLPFTIEFFPLDIGARSPVEINLVVGDRIDRVAYDPAAFALPPDYTGPPLPDDLGYAGFRLRDKRAHDHEWLAFKGASYFRSPGPDNQYGLSARALAVNIGLADRETFPNFTRFWIVTPAPEDKTITIYALLDGEAVTGAYRMRCSRPGDVIMDIECRLFQRTDIERLGVAPLTSMYWFSETDARFGRDWRPEVHDSDGLAIANGDGEQIWRALDNPPRPDISLFDTSDLQGFGLLQRDRDAAHYMVSRAVAFERRPSAWVTPHGDWGPGQVGLYEWPTDLEYNDNVNAFWIPARRAVAGTAWAFAYRLDWTAAPSFGTALARVVSTRTGWAGRPSDTNVTPTDRKFVIDFAGGPVGPAKPGPDVAIDIDASVGTIGNPYVVAADETQPVWRVFFDWRGQPPADSPVVLRCQLTRAGKPLSERWVYSYFPRPLPNAH